MSTAHRAARERRSDLLRSRVTPRTRLSAPERRRDLLRVAGGLMATRGVDGVQLAAVAVAAGVTRPVVYRFFANRRVLIIAVLFANLARPGADLFLGPGATPEALSDAMHAAWTAFPIRLTLIAGSRDPPRGGRRVRTWRPARSPGPPSRR